MLGADRLNQASLVQLMVPIVQVFGVDDVVVVVVTMSAHFVLAKSGCVCEISGDLMVNRGVDCKVFVHKLLHRQFVKGYG